jgi:hypothetical protein
MKMSAYEISAGVLSKKIKETDSLTDLNRWKAEIVSEIGNLKRYKQASFASHTVAPVIAGALFGPTVGSQTIARGGDAKAAAEKHIKRFEKLLFQVNAKILKVKSHKN